MKTAKTRGQAKVLGIDNELCVWSRAQVVKPVRCINAFDCLGCSFDRKVRADVRKQTRQQGPKADPRPARLRLLADQRKCRHMLSGRVDFKLCGHGYDCVRCPYDQMLEDAFLHHPAPRPRLVDVAGFEVADGYYYHHGHSWARVEYGGRVRVGMDDFSARLLGPAERLVLPGLGEQVEASRPMGTIQRGRHTALAMAPVTGKVVAVNSKAIDDPGQAADSPYGDGWWMVIQPQGLRKDLKNLFFGRESVAWMEEEAGRLSAMLAADTRWRLAATGGRAVDDIYGTVKGLDWNRLVEAFLC